MAQSEGHPLHDLTGFQRDLLSTVAGLDEPNGLDVKAAMESAYGTAEINHGRLYPNLDTLVQKGLVEKGEQDKRTNWYSITARGRRELSAHVEWTQGLLYDA